MCFAVPVAGLAVAPRSMELWPQWVDALASHEPLTLQTPLLQMAADAESAERMAALVQHRADLGLELLTSEQLQDIWPHAAHGGLHSRMDGRIDPLGLQSALRRRFPRPTLTPSPAVL